MPNLSRIGTFRVLRRLSACINRRIALLEAQRGLIDGLHYKKFRWVLARKTSDRACQDVPGRPLQLPSFRPANYARSSMVRPTRPSSVSIEQASSPAGVLALNVS